MESHWNGRKYVNEVVSEHFSEFGTWESVAKWRKKRVVACCVKEEDIVFEPCEPGESVCLGRPVCDMGDHFYVYATLVADLHVYLPFTQFEMDVLKKMNVAPTQLHPNGWAYVKAFQILCSAFGFFPTVGVFFAFHEGQVDKGGWVSLKSQQGRAILRPFRSNYKYFKEKFFRVMVVGGFRELLLDDSGNFCFPLYWEEDPILDVDDGVLGEVEQEVMGFFEKLAPIESRELIRLEFSPKEMMRFLLPMAPMKAKELKAYFHKIPAEKQVEAPKAAVTRGQKRRAEGEDGGEGENIVVAIAKKVASSIKVPPKGVKNKEKSPIPPPDSVIDLEKVVIDLDSGGVLQAHYEASLRLYASYQNGLSEASDMRGRMGVLVKENDDLKTENSRLEGEVERLKKSAIDEKSLHEKELKRLKDANTQLSKEVKSQKELSSSQANESAKLKAELEELKGESAGVLNDGFQRALEQVKALNPEVNLEGMAIWRAVKNGLVVTPASSVEGGDEHVGDQGEVEQPIANVGESTLP